MNHIKVLTSDQAFAPQEIASLVKDPSAGAVSTYSGFVRGKSGDKDISYVSFEGDPEVMEARMLEMAQEVRQKWDLIHIAMYHRIGRIPAGEESGMIAISSPHRKDSIQAIDYLVDQMKMRLRGENKKYESVA
ncbi:Molybdopterin biosynthesis MoaE [Basidiobolus meristosporus CBS 931.73]|uniref:Molybdopterin biosynthesis MoaE n=1 Tax=Basidiobolus meristosporus CBS 931.73 TaxID=1314790 RepID=A0A1Y1Y6S4_9FUNG|nr:Molybdopterin biosynthesis MoaE [Basidiobolus meristosporus CBS 931.73]|eukprot:ORX93436.1 Molybdopterin biosynthesis MoaE [Basidiobolus meristosporus CBS 931.73]